MFAIRVPLAILAGTAISVALFLTLSQLVGVSFDASPSAQGYKIDFTPKRPDTPVVTKRDEKITREPPTLVPDGPEIITDDFRRDDFRTHGYQRPTLEPPIRNDGIGMRGVDGDVRPIVRTNPDYPPRALAANTEGWVQVRFTVTAAGTVRDAVVVASEPGTVFDEAALRAIARWRYTPRVESGVAVERVGLQTIIRFELEN